MLLIVPYSISSMVIFEKVPLFFFSEIAVIQVGAKDIQNWKCIDKHCSKKELHLNLYSAKTYSQFQFVMFCEIMCFFPLEFLVCLCETAVFSLKCRMLWIMVCQKSVFVHAVASDL